MLGLLALATIRQSSLFRPILHRNTIRIQNNNEKSIYNGICWWLLIVTVIWMAGIQHCPMNRQFDSITDSIIIETDVMINRQMQWQQQQQHCLCLCLCISLGNYIRMMMMMKPLTESNFLFFVRLSIHSQSQVKSTIRHFRLCTIIEKWHSSWPFFLCKTTWP